MGWEIDIAWLTLLLFGSLGVLLALGLPMAFCTGSSRGRLPVPVREFGDPEHDAGAHLPVHDRLPALRRAAVHLHGGDAGEGRHHRGAVRRGLQMARRGEGRARRRDRACLHGARRDGRRRRRDRSHHGHDRAAGDAQARLRPEARLRLAARRRHARHPHPAVGDGDRLCGGGAAVARRAAGRLDLSRACCCPASTSPTS